jgi:hypothetical protein
VLLSTKKNEHVLLHNHYHKREKNRMVLIRVKIWKSSVDDLVRCRGTGKEEIFMFVWKSFNEGGAKFLLKLPFRPKNTTPVKFEIQPKA